MNRNEIESTRSTLVCNKQSEYKLGCLSDNNNKLWKFLRYFLYLCAIIPYSLVFDKHGTLAPRVCLDFLRTVIQ